MRRLLIIFSLIGICPAYSWAKEVSMVCHDSYYFCGTDRKGNAHCGWPTGRGRQRNFDLTKDPSYPNENFPYEIWNGVYRESVNGGVAKIRLRFTNNPDWSPTSASISFSWGGLTAESSGESKIEVKLRNEEKGSGFSCHTFSVH